MLDAELNSQKNEVDSTSVPASISDNTSLVKEVMGFKSK